MSNLDIRVGKIEELKYNQNCSCKCVNHPDIILIKERFTGQGYCHICDNYNLSDEYDNCFLCRALYEQSLIYQQEINKLEGMIELLAYPMKRNKP